jgi:diguanylate cyclase (GGDEF)-like protein
MFYIDTINQISFLTITCFSFLIFIFTLSLNKEKSHLKLLGTAFFIPFALSITSFLAAADTLQSSLAITSELGLLLALSLLLTFRPKAKYYSFIQALLFIMPSLLFLLVYRSSFISDMILVPKVYITLFILLSLLPLYDLRNKKDDESKIFWGVFLILLCNTIVQFGLSPSIIYFLVAVKILAYILFFAYFYSQSFYALMGKVNEAEKVLKSVNKSLDLEVKKRIFEIEKSNRKLIDLTKTDHLTKTLNKSAILEAINNQISSKSNKEFSILMFDIDNFKIINDKLGHLAGDKCLRKLSTIGSGCLRSVDYLGRYGGDEFIILLTGMTAPQAKLSAERLRKKVSESESPRITISIGIATYPSDAFTTKELIAIADQGLYMSKNKGRNAVSHKNFF